MKKDRATLTKGCLSGGSLLYKKVKERKNTLSGIGLSKRGDLLRGSIEVCRLKRSAGRSLALIYKNAPYAVRVSTQSLFGEPYVCLAYCGNHSQKH